MSTFKQYLSKPSDEGFIGDFIDALGRGQILVHISGHIDEKLASRSVYLAGYTASDWINMDESSVHAIWMEWSDVNLDVRDWQSLMALYNYDGNDFLKKTTRNYLRIKNFIDVRVHPMGSIEFGAYYVSKENNPWLERYINDLGTSEHHGLIEWYHVPRKIKDVLMVKIEKNMDQIKSIIRELRIHGRIYILKKGFGAYWAGGHTTLTELIETEQFNKGRDIMDIVTMSRHVAFKREMEEELGAKPHMKISLNTRVMIPGRFNIVELTPAV